MDYIEKIRLEFEDTCNKRAWFQPEYHENYDYEEGITYDDFTTDMCWTSWFAAWKKYK